MSTTHHITIKGVYTLLPNPCSSRPCLPGMVYAIEAGTTYFPTVANNLLAATHTWRRYTPQPGEEVAVTGTLHARQDILGNHIATIEVIAVEPAVV